MEKDTLPVVSSALLGGVGAGAITHIGRSNTRKLELDKLGAAWSKERDKRLAEFVAPIADNIDSYRVRDRVKDKLSLIAERVGIPGSSYLESGRKARASKRVEDAVAVFKATKRPIMMVDLPTKAVRSKNRLIVLGTALGGATLAGGGMLIGRKTARRMEKSASIMPPRTILKSQFLGDLAGGNVSALTRKAREAAEMSATFANDGSKARQALTRSRFDTDVKLGKARGEDSALFTRPADSLTPEELAAKKRLEKKYGPTFMERLRGKNRTAADTLSKKYRADAETLANAALEETARVKATRKKAKAGAVVGVAGVGGIAGAYKLGVIPGLGTPSTPPDATGVYM